jgi:DNA repair exonuclease SbcCD ATPase subunit
MDTDKTQQTPAQAHQRPAYMTTEGFDRLLGERNTARAELAKVRITTEQMGRPVAEDVTDWLWKLIARRNEMRAERAAAIVRAEKAEAELARLNEHLPTVERLTRELAETEAELAISTRRLESASQERDHHLHALVAARMEIAARKTGGAS